MQKLAKITVALIAGLIGAYIGFYLAAEVIWCYLMPRATPELTVTTQGYDPYDFSSSCLQGCQPINLQGVTPKEGVTIDQNLTYSN